MRFPRRLALDLARVRIAQKIYGPQSRPVVLHINPAEFSLQSNPGLHTSAQLLQRVRQSAAPVIWLSSTLHNSRNQMHSAQMAPLATSPHSIEARHSERSEESLFAFDSNSATPLTRELLATCRTVFLEIDGLLLRRQVFQFRPTSRFYFVIELNGPEPSHDARAGKPGLFRATLEGIRAAQLSGFHICALTRIFPDTKLEELQSLAETIANLKLDGWVQNAHNPQAGVPAEIIRAARQLIPNRKWQMFSEMLERADPAESATETSRPKEKLLSPMEENIHTGAGAIAP